MQEEVENRTVTLAINTTKLTGRTFKAALQKYLAYLKSKKQNKSVTDVKPTGKQTVKELVGQNLGVNNVEISDKGVKYFDRVARKYGIDYAIKKDKSGEVPKYLVFFKARDSDAIVAAIDEYTNVVNKKQTKPSVIAKLKTINPLNLVKKPRVKNKDRGRDL